MNFAWNARIPRSIQESFTCRKSTTRHYFPSEGRRAEDFFVPVCTWVPKASTLPLDHQSCFFTWLVQRSSPSFSSTTFRNVQGISYVHSKVSTFPHHAKLCSERSTLLVASPNFKSSLLVNSLLVECCFCHGNLEFNLTSFVTMQPQHFKRYTFSSSFWSMIICTGDGCLVILPCCYSIIPILGH